MWVYVLGPALFPLLCFILALLWHLEMKDLWKIWWNKEQHLCSCCYGNRVIIWERVSHPSIWTGCCLPTQITYYCLCRAADKVMYYRKTIKKWDDDLRRATIRKWLPTVCNSRPYVVCHGCDTRRRSQTDPARGAERYSFHIREIKVWVWEIISILHSTALLWITELCPTNATATESYTADLCSTMTWRILRPALHAV